MTTYAFGGFWRRSIAYIIDGFIVSIVLIVVSVVGSVAYFSGAMSGDSSVIIAQLTDPIQLSSLTVWIWLLTFAVNIAYFTYFHGSTGRTPGKMLLGLQVVSVTGAPISFGTAFLRSVGYLVSGIVFCLGYLWIAFDRRKQGWHDKIAGTVVIIREPRGNEAGISIPDPDSGSRDSSRTGGAAPTDSALEGNRPETVSAEDTTGVGGQKMP